MSKTIALMTARSGSKNPENKNMLPSIIPEMPMFLFNLRAACHCDDIDEVYLTTDISEASLWSEFHGYNIIKRPEVLCGDDVPHYDVMRHAVDVISNEHDFTTLVLLLGNNSGCNPSNLKEALKILKTHPDADSVMSVGRFNQFNPYRAFKKGSRGQYLTTCAPQDEIPNQANDKNAAGDVYFFNGSFWVVRKNTFMKNNGLRPYPWLGTSIMEYHQPEHIQEIDSDWQYDLISTFGNSAFLKD